MLSGSFESGAFLRTTVNCDYIEILKSWSYATNTEDSCFEQEQVYHEVYSSTTESLQETSCAVVRGSKNHKNRLTGRVMIMMMAEKRKKNDMINLLQSGAHAV